MDLKFSLDASNPLPLATAGAGSASPGAGSSGLELQVSVEQPSAGTDAAAGGPRAVTVVCEARSRDGVSYARVEKTANDRHPSALAAAVRSVLARAGATLPEPLLPAVSCVALALGGAEAAALVALGLPVDSRAEGDAPLSAVDAALQARTGIAAGTPIRLAGSDAAA